MGNLADELADAFSDSDDGEYHDDRSSLQARLLRVVEASELIQRLAKPPLGEVNGS